MYDVIVVGARCAGSSTGMLLARKGYRVLLLDKATFPSDTMSGHYIHAKGVAKLKRWGLLDQVIASNCPAITQLHIDLGSFSLECAILPVDDVAATYAPRRYLLDKILVDAAVEAGAELREGFHVQELLMENGRVVGIRGLNANGSLVIEKARIVIGADGKHSHVARQVEAATYHSKPTLSCAYGAYWSGIPVSEFASYPREHCTILTIPTNNQLTLIAIQWSIEQFPFIRTNLESYFMKTLELVPALAEQVRAGRQEERFLGTGDQPNFFRKPSGPGWALVGDAGYHKDPILGHGISDAFRDAELLADAIDAGFTERTPLPEALSTYEQQRNEIALPLYELNSQRATQEPPSEEMRQLFHALRTNPTERDRFAATTAGTISPKEFFAPEHVARILEAAHR